MSREEIRGQFMEYVGDDNVLSLTLLESLLDNAIEEVRNVRYPFGYASESIKRRQDIDVISRYGQIILQVAEYHFDKMGKEGITEYSENGTSAVYDCGGTPPSYFRGIVSVGRIV